jgi:hypothetical protein
VNAVLRRSAALALAAALALVAVLLAPVVPTAKAAASADVIYTCATSAFDVDFIAADTTYEMTVNIPTTIENGSSFNVRWSIDELPTTPPLPLSGVSVVTTAQLAVDRPGLPTSVIESVSEVGDVVDLEPSAPIPGELDFVDRYRFEAATAGDVFTVRPGSIVFDYVTGDDGFAGASTTCTPVTPGTVLVQTAVQGELLDCVLTDTCTGEQTFVGDPPPTSLVLDRDPEDGPASSVISFPAIQTGPDATAQVVNDVGFARVTDTRTQPYGWSMTIEASTLTSEQGGTINPSTLSVDEISCAPPAGATGGAPAAEGAGGALGVARGLCSVEPGDLGPTGAAGGQWDVFGRVSMQVPAFARSGSYSGTLVLTVA